MPMTVEQYEKKLDEPVLCEQLPVRDFLNNVMVRTNGAFVAGYELRGITSYFAPDEERNRSKAMLGTLLKAIPEQSMTMQVRYEVAEDLGNLLSAYDAQNRSDAQVVNLLDAHRLAAWQRKEEQGYYLRPLLSAYLLWDPRIHHRLTGKTRREKNTFSLFAKAAIEKSRQEHEELLAEFESLLLGIESTLQAADLGPRRMSDDELFREVKRALNPLDPDSRPHIPGGDWLRYRSAREQLATLSILQETDSYINIGGLLYTFVSLKEPPDATFPGILRELIALDFPVIVNAQLIIPDQTKVLKSYRSRLRKMQAAQHDTRGGLRVNVEAQVAESQLFKVQQDLIASSVKTTKLSLVVGTRTSRPATTHAEFEQAERTISNRRQQLLHAVARMNGAKAITETLAKRRLFFSSLPGMSEPDRREQDLLTSNAADLLPVETPWQGTPRSPLFLFETPYRQLVPFSLFDSSLSDANMLIMAKSGGGKTFMVQQLLSMASRANPLVSIIERGDSYRPLVELMAGRMITMSLDSTQTLNPWDLPSGETQPSKDQIAFLKNLTRHMLGENTADDTDLLDILITEAILRTYKRAAIRPSNPIPTFCDLRDELAQWRDEDKNQRVMDEAHLAAIKLRAWTGEQGIYSRLFDRHTTISLENPWLFFNVEKLADDPRLETAMSLLIAHATAQRASGTTGQPSITVLDECWFLLDSHLLAPEVVQLFRTARKRHGSVWGISQTAEDFVGSEAKPRVHGAGIIKNSNTKVVGQQPGDVTALRDHLHLNETALAQIKGFAAPRKGRSADALIAIGEKAETTHTIRLVPTAVEYWITTTYPRERAYRSWALSQRKGTSLIEVYEELAQRFPFGLADIDPLPEEASGEVVRGVQQR
jgi:hypothetical protein